MAKMIGMGGSVYISSTPYPVSTWSINVSNDVQDVTDTGSGGWVARLAGVNSGELTFTAFWDGAGTLLSTTFAIGASATLLPHIGSSGDMFTIPCVISSFTVTNGAKTPVEFQCTAQSNGAVTMPS